MVMSSYLGVGDVSTRHKDRAQHPDGPSNGEVILTWILTLLLSAAYTTWGDAGRKRRLSAARRNAWAGGMLYKDIVSL